MSTTRRMSGAYEQDRLRALKGETHPTGPNGRLLCRYCQTEVPAGRRKTFCSDECVTEWRVRTNPGYVRQQLLKRDHGICSVCGIDCMAVMDAMVTLPRSPNAGYRPCKDSPRHVFLMQPELLPWHKGAGWQAHHVLAVVKGGGECGLDNYATICHRCHVAETTKLRQRLAQKRADKKAMQNSQL